MRKEWNSGVGFFTAWVHEKGPRFSGSSRTLSPGIVILYCSGRLYCPVFSYLLFFLLHSQGGHESGFSLIGRLVLAQEEGAVKRGISQPTATAFIEIWNIPQQQVTWMNDIKQMNVAKHYFEEPRGIQCIAVDSILVCLNILAVLSIQCC